MNNCDCCFNDFLAKCETEIVINTNLTAGDSYRWVITNKFGNKYEGTAIAGEEGELTIPVEELPAGMFTQFSADFLLHIYAGESCTPIKFKLTGEYDCVNFNIHGGTFVKNNIGCTTTFVPGASGGPDVIDITYAALLSAQEDSSLTEGATYQITDRGDRGLLFEAISDSELSRTGIRKMLCPSFYGTGANLGKTWIGVWNANKNPNIGDLAIWGGLVWESLTGNIGTATTDILLDVVNWAVVPKASFSSDEYLEMQFGVSYDVNNDWIERQWDGAGNVFGIDFHTESIENRGVNFCDISDWNFSSGGGQFYNNKAYGVYNNSCPSIISNTVYRIIANNSNTSNIIDNWVGSEIYNNSNAGAIQDNFIMVGIAGNSNNGKISFNRCDNIQSNSNVGHIERNIIPGHIEDNINVGFISWNMNNGDIEACESGVDPCNIHHNINNGDISGTYAADVLDTIVDK